jgi:biotin transport system substrate-specific component
MNSMYDSPRAATSAAVPGPGARRLFGAAAFATITALSAFAEVYLPGTPVPVTLQTMFVVLSGVMLGPWLGAAAQSAYVMAGMLGAPVFAGAAFGPAHLFGPTGGYLLAFPLAAFVAGVVAGRPDAATGAFRWLRTAGGLALGAAVILIGGAAQLALITGDAARAVQLGVLPFLLPDALKVVAATMVAVKLARMTRSRL